jgi:multidrug efflux system membrane fusion protein
MRPSAGQDAVIGPGAGNHVYQSSLLRHSPQDIGTTVGYNRYSHPLSAHQLALRSRSERSTMRFKNSLSVLLAIANVVALSSCRPAALETKPSGPTTVTVSRPIVREVTDYRVFTGTTSAVQTVDVQARVTGYLVKLPFAEGSVVKEGELLAEIDPRPYQAKVDAAQGEVALYEAQLKLAKIDNDRGKAIRAQNAGAISQQELDTREAKVEESAAAVQSAKATLEQYNLDLEFTKIRAPIEGRVSRYYQSVGTLVTQNETLITTIVSQAPIYVYFDVDEQTMLQVLRSMYSNELPPARSRQIPVSVGLQDDTGFPHAGTVDFANNVVDSSTGTIVVRGEFANPANEAGVRMLLPGMFVRVKLPIGRPRRMPLVVERAIVNDQGQTFVYVVDDQRQVQYRRVRLGRMTEDGLWVVEEGITPDDRVIVGGIQFAKPGEKVQVKEAPSPPLVKAKGAETDVSHSREPVSEPTERRTPAPSSASPQ